jgi:hypothetical protein
VRDNGPMFISGYDVSVTPDGGASIRCMGAKLKYQKLEGAND